MARLNGVASLFQRRGDRSETSTWSRGIFGLLATSRFLAVVLVVALTVVVESREPAEVAPVAIASVAALVSALIVFIGPRLLTLPWKSAQAFMAADAGIGAAGILISGGIDSPFLLYALLPVLTSALLMDRSFALGLALVPGGTVVLAHTVLSWTGNNLSWILEGNYLTLVPVYASVSVAVAVVPFYTNLNLRRAEEEQVRRSEQRLLRAELHDKLAQSLSALTMGLRQMRRVGSSAEQLGDLTEVSERSYAELRELLDLLEAGSWQPSAMGTVARLVEAWADESGVRVEASYPSGDLALPPEVTITILGIAREALTNVGKHSAATRVDVTLEDRPEAVSLAIRDNGRGFSEDRPSGHGRRIMQERADSIGATLSVVSGRGQGTTVVVWYPREH